MSPERFLRTALGLLLMTAGLAAMSHSAWGQIDLKKTAPFGSTIDVSDDAFQLRVEQRIIIRIPRQTAAVANMGNRSSAKIATIRYKEEKIGKCLLMDRLVGSRPGNKESLDLVTRDGVLIRAYLGDGCLAREFYAGAYMERPLDGKLCIDRDMLYARTGAKCEVDKFRLLVPK
jgi:hypothetical protein